MITHARRHRFPVEAVRRRLSRRRFLEVSIAAAGVGAAAPLMTACGQEQRERGGRIDPNQDVAIDFWHEFPDKPKRDALAEIVARFQEANPNVTIDTRSYPDGAELLQATQAALASGEVPALSSLYLSDVRYVAANLPHLPAEEAAARDRGGAGWLGEFPRYVLELGEAGGMVQAMPNGYTLPVLFYNRDLLGRAALEAPPRTWAEFREHARRLTDETGEAGAYLLETPDFFVQQGLVESNGGRLLVDADGRPRAGIDDPEAVAALQLAADMVLEDETALHTSLEQGLQAFSSGAVGMLVGPSSLRGNIEGSADFELAFDVFPSWGEKKRRIPAAASAPFIFAEEEQEQLVAWEFVKFFNSPESITRWTEASGYVPNRPGLTEDERHLKSFVEKDRLMQITIDSAPYAAPWLSWPGDKGPEAAKVLVDMLDRILSGDQDVPGAAGEAAGRIDGLISG